jgi:hypothetical protein
MAGASQNRHPHCSEITASLRAKGEAIQDSTAVAGLLRFARNDEEKSEAVISERTLGGVRR